MLIDIWLGAGIFAAPLFYIQGECVRFMYVHVPAAWLGMGGWAGIAAFAYQHRGKVHYDEGDYESARKDFKRALFLRQESGASDDKLESTLLAIDAADRRRAAASVAS